MDVDTAKKWTIGLCDDTYVWYLRWKKELSDFLEEQRETADFLYFPDAVSLLENEQEMDVLFLDICLETGPDGISLAGQLKEKNRRCKIVYLTNYLTYAVDVYRTEHSYFVLKEQFRQRLEEVFGKLRIQRRQKILHISVPNKGEVLLQSTEICYIERDRHTTKVVADSGVYFIRDKLDALEKVLTAPEMLRCHNSYIVNLTHVREMCKGYFLLKDQTMIPISRSYTRPVKDQFIQWAMEQAEGAL